MPLKPDIAAESGSGAHDPLRLLRLVAGGLLLVATVFAIVLAILGVPKALLLVGSFWALYGLVLGIIGGVLEPLIDWLAVALTDIGLGRAGAGYSAIEAMEARGDYEGAAAAYQNRATTQPGRVEPWVRRATVLAGPLRDPERAAHELEALRTSRRLSRSDDTLLGLALAELYERHLNDPGRAMAELRRLIDAYPAAPHGRRLRDRLAALKASRASPGPT